MQDLTRNRSVIHVPDEDTAECDDDATSTDAKMPTDTKEVGVGNKY